MASTAVSQASCWQVKNADKQGGEHVRLIITASRVVHSLHDKRRIALAQGDVVEQRLADGHDECGGDALATDVANTEE